MIQALALSSHKSDVAMALRWEKAGVKVIDIYKPIPAESLVQQELHAVVRFIEAIKKQSALRICVQTSRANTMRAAIEAGVDFIHDPKGFIEPEIWSVIQYAKVHVCLPKLVAVGIVKTHCLCQELELLV